MLPFLKIFPGIIPILHSFGVIIPGQFGPMICIPCSEAYFFAYIISLVGIPSVIITANFIPLLLASKIASFANLGGTNIIDVLAPVAFIASFTVLKTGNPR